MAAYRASLVSKGGAEGEGLYGNYNNYQGGNPQYPAYPPQGNIPSPPMASAPPPPSQSPIGKKTSPMMGSINSPPQQHQNIMQSNLGPVPNHMNMQQHMQQQQHNNYMQPVSNKLVGFFCNL